MVNDKDNDSATLTPEIIDVDERDNYLLVLNDAIQFLHHKAVNGRIRDAKNEKSEHEKVKIDYFRALIYAISTANNVYKDKQIDKLVNDVDMLKNMYLRKSGDNAATGLSESAKAELDEIDAKIESLKENI